MNVRNLFVPVVAAGLLLGGASVSQAQYFNYSTTFSDGTTTASSTVMGQTVLINTTNPGTFLTASPQGFTTGANALVGTSVSLFTLDPTSSGANAAPNSGGFAITDTNYTYTFTLQRVSDTNGTSNIGAPVTFSGGGTITGGLDASTDTVNIGPGPRVGGGVPSGVPISFVAGGENFNVVFDSRRNPGIPGIGLPTGGVTFFVTSSAVPEPGSVAMMIGMAVSGSAFVLRRRRAVK